MPPSRTALRPVKRAEPNAALRESSDTSGWVNRKTTTRSRIVDMPSVNAKPRTSPAANSYRTAAARNDTMSAEMIVRRARIQARGHRDPHRSPLVHFVLYSFEQHDERVGGDTDGDDEAGDAGQGQREADLAAEDDQRGVGQPTRDQQRGDRDQAERAVVEQRIDHDQDQADAAGEQARLELRATQRGRDGRVVSVVNFSGSAPYLSEFARSVGLLLGEADR